MQSPQEVYLLGFKRVSNMSDDFSECIFTEDDPEVEVTISHHRDMLVFGGKIEQDYRFLTYLFPNAAGDVVATVYLDDAHCIRITGPVFGNPIPEKIFFYMQRRFGEISQLGGSNGYVELWKSKPPKKRH
jgi:hypothetical protein